MNDIIDFLDRCNFVAFCISGCLFLADLLGILLLLFFKNPDSPLTVTPMFKYLVVITIALIISIPVTLLTHKPKGESATSKPSKTDYNQVAKVVNRTETKGIADPLGIRDEKDW